MVSYVLQLCWNSGANTNEIANMYHVTFLILVSVGPDGTDIKIKKSFTFTDPIAAQKILHLDPNSILRKEGRFVGDTLKTNTIRTPRVCISDI